MTSSGARQLGSWQTTLLGPDIPRGYALRVWSLSLSLQTVCLHAHGQNDNTDGQRWARKEKQSNTGYELNCEGADFHCPSLPLSKSQPHTQDLLYFSLGSVMQCVVKIQINMPPPFINVVHMLWFHRFERRENDSCCWRAQQSCSCTLHLQLPNLGKQAPGSRRREAGQASHTNTHINIFCRLPQPLSLG